MTPKIYSPVKNRIKILSMYRATLRDFQVFHFRFFSGKNVQSLETDSFESFFFSHFDLYNLHETNSVDCRNWNPLDLEHGENENSDRRITLQRIMKKCYSNVALGPPKFRAG